MEYARYRRVRIHQRAACLQHSRAGRVQFMVGVDEEQHIESLLKDWVWSVVLFAHVIHLIQEGACVAQTAGGRDEVTPLTNAIRHSKRQ